MGTTGIRSGVVDGFTARAWVVPSVSISARACMAVRSGLRRPRRNSQLTVLCSRSLGGRRIGCIIIGTYR